MGRHGKKCIGELSEPTDAYEFSFVAVPAQPGAGVTKSTPSLDAAFELLLTADLSNSMEKIAALIKRFHQFAMEDEERKKRADIQIHAEKIKQKYIKTED